MRILIVEDDEDIRISLQQLLADDGYTVRTVKNGYLALEALRDMHPHPPHLILLDMAMPVMNGFEFREQQLREADFCHVPVVCISAMHWSEWMRDKLGADAYLAKPLTVSVLDELVRRYDPRNNAPSPVEDDDTRKTRIT